MSLFDLAKRGAVKISLGKEGGCFESFKNS